MEKIWNELFDNAKNKLNAKEVSDFVYTGNNACAILTSKNNIFVGNSITSNSSLDCSAEKSALVEMLNNNEYAISKMVIVNELEEIIMPSLKTLENLLELGTELSEVEILVSLEKNKVVKLNTLLPSWWGTYRNIKY